MLSKIWVAEDGEREPQEYWIKFNVEKYGINPIGRYECFNEDGTKTGKCAWGYSIFEHYPTEKEFLERCLKLNSMRIDKLNKDALESNDPFSAASSSSIAKKIEARNEIIRKKLSEL